MKYKKGEKEKNSRLFLYFFGFKLLIISKKNGIIV